MLKINCVFLLFLTCSADNFIQCREFYPVRRIKKIIIQKLLLYKNFFFVETYNNGKTYNTRTKANRKKKRY